MDRRPRWVAWVLVALALALLLAALFVFGQDAPAASGARPAVCPDASRWT